MNTDRQAKSYQVSIRQRRDDVQQLRDTLRKLRSADYDDADLISASLCRYLVVRSAGYLESVRDDLADEFVRSTSHPRVHNFVATGLRNGQGVSPKQLIGFVKKFDALWADELTKFLEQDESRLSNDLGALVAARKKIAHGSGDQVTESKAIRYADAALEIGRWLEQVFRRPAS